MLSRVSSPERVVSVRPRTIMSVLGLVLLVALSLWIVFLSWRVITWLLVAIFLACALNPAVEFFIRRGLRRGTASGVVFFLAIVVIGGIAYLVIPPLVSQVSDFIEAVPSFVEDLTAGRGPLGFLQSDYHIVDRIRQAIAEQGPGGVLGITKPALGVAQTLFTAVVGVVTISFLTLFMLLRGKETPDRILSLVPEHVRPYWERAALNVYRSIGGYVTGNLLISLIAGAVSAGVLFAVGSKYAVALAVIVAVFDLVPLAGATIGAVIVTTVVTIETDWIRGVIVIVFFLVYQQFENHVLQPVIYGRTVQLSPLYVLVAVLIGAELAGILGALVAIPIAGSVGAIVEEILRYRRDMRGEADATAVGAPGP
jgi:predicted PurR-regulated permease PerM